METYCRTFSRTILASILLLSGQLVARADSTVTQAHPPALSKAVASDEPCRLTLSLGDQATVGPLSPPDITLNLTNGTKYTLTFPWTFSPTDAAFEVDYKAATDNPSLETGWKRLQPNIQPHPDAGNQINPADPGVHAYSGSSIRFEIAPGQQNNGIVLSPDFSMSKDGFYRIRATMSIKKAFEFLGPASSPTFTKHFVLAEHSQPLVLRHTSTGFSIIEISTGK